MAVFVIFWLILACMLEIQLSLCWLAKNLTGLSGGSHLHLKPYAAFIHWCRTFDYIDQTPSAFWNALFEFHRNICDQTIETSVLLIKVEELFEDHVQPLICKFRQWGCDASPTFKYWDMFLVAIQIMERERDWSAHLMSSSKMLPYFFITNCTNYSRWMPVYILDMLDLSAEIKSAFEKGEFFIRQHSQKSWVILLMNIHKPNRVIYDVSK